MHSLSGNGDQGVYIQRLEGNFKVCSKFDNSRSELLYIIIDPTLQLLLARFYSGVTTTVKPEIFMGVFSTSLHILHIIGLLNLLNCKHFDP